jgi:hypothetical protein
MTREWTTKEETTLLRAVCHFKPVGTSIGYVIVIL